MNFSAGSLWKVKDVGCNLWSRREWAQTVLFVALLGGSYCSCVFLFFLKKKLCFNFLPGAMCIFFGHVWCLRWCHCRMGHNVEVLHYQPNDKVGNHLAHWPAWMAAAPQRVKRRLSFSDRPQQPVQIFLTSDWSNNIPVYMLELGGFPFPEPRKYIITGTQLGKGKEREQKRHFQGLLRQSTLSRTCLW